MLAIQRVVTRRYSLTSKARVLANLVHRSGFVCFVFERWQVLDKNERGIVLRISFGIAVFVNSKRKKPSLLFILNSPQ